MVACLAGILGVVCIWLQGETWIGLFTRWMFVLGCAFWQQLWGYYWQPWWLRGSCVFSLILLTCCTSLVQLLATLACSFNTFHPDIIWLRKVWGYFGCMVCLWLDGCMAYLWLCWYILVNVTWNEFTSSVVVAQSPGGQSASAVQWNGNVPQGVCCNHIMQQSTTAAGRQLFIK